jgi:hypothetical protein
MITNVPFSTENKKVAQQCTVHCKNVGFQTQSQPLQCGVQGFWWMMNVPVPEEYTSLDALPGRVGTESGGTTTYSNIPPAAMGDHPHPFPECVRVPCVGERPAQEFYGIGDTCQGKVYGQRCILDIILIGTSDDPELRTETQTERTSFMHIGTYLLFPDVLLHFI